MKFNFGKVKEWSLKKKIGAGLLVLVAGWLILRSGGKEEKVNYLTEKVKKGEVVDLVSETGEVMSTANTQVKSTIKGVVTEVYVENGSVVYRGQNLYYVKSTATAQERAAAYSAYLTAKNALDTAERNLWTFESDMWVAHEIFETDALDPDKPEVDPIYIETQRDWLAAEDKYLDQEQVITQAKAAVSSTWFAYQAMIDGPVQSTIDGEVANLAVAEGLQVETTEVALVIKSQAVTWVSLAVNETDINELSSEQKAVVTIDALDDKEIEATVKRVDEVGTVDSGVVTFNVYLSLIEEDLMVRQGMTAQVEITTQEKQDVVVVKNEAIKPYQGGKAVQVVGNSGKLIYKPVEVGIRGVTMSEIVSGLEAGDEIVVSENGAEAKSGGGFMGIAH
jgi:multidrug efflux pump subunit AcrA (membrane-fusion protein)